MSNFIFYCKQFMFFPLIFFSVPFNAFSQAEYVDINRTRDLNLNGYVLINIRPVNNVGVNGNIPGWLHNYGWGCNHPLEDAIYLMENRVLDVGNNLNLNADEGFVNCWIENSSRDFSAAMIRSEDTFTFGLFELRCVLPNSKFSTPAFWLFGEGNNKSPYNEIDVFEGGPSDWIVQCNHSATIDPQSGIIRRVSEHESINSLPGTTFGGSAVTYALRWDPNKIVWYINGIPVRTKLECLNNPLSTTVVPSAAMQIFVNNGITTRNLDFNRYLPDGPDPLIIEDLRVYRRNIEPQDPNVPICNFTLMGENSNDCENPINIEYTKNVPIMVDLNNSYLPEHRLLWLIYDIQSNCASENVILDAGEVDFCADYNTKYIFNLNEVIDELSEIELNNLYRLRIVPFNPLLNIYDFNSACDVVFNPVTCIDRIEYRVNGIDVCVGSIEVCTETVITIGDNHGKSRIILDLSTVQTCENKIFVAIQESDQFYNLYNNEVSSWLDVGQLSNRANFDLEDFAKSNGLNLCDNTYYRVKVATTTANNIWIEKTQLILLEECTINFIPTINEQIGTMPININQGDEIYLDLTTNNFCSKNYTVSIINHNTNELIARKHFNFYSSTVFLTHEDDSYTTGRIDLRNLIDRPSPNPDSSYILECGIVYDVFITTDGDVCDNSFTRMISFELEECTDNTSEFMWRSDICWRRGVFVFDDYNPLTIPGHLDEPDINPDVYLFAPNMIS